MESDGTQCGFCTPGFVMAIEAMRRAGDPPRDDIIHDALAGNLCRCTGYRPIVEACRRALAAPTGLDDADEGAHAAALARASTPMRYEKAEQRYRFPHHLEELLAALAEDPQARLVAGATDLGLLVSKASEPLPSLVSTERVAELRARRRQCRRADARGRRHLCAGVARISTRTFRAFAALGAPHRLAADPGARHVRRQSRHRLAHRRHAAVPDGARCPVDFALRNGDRTAHRRGLHHRLPHDSPCGRRGYRGGGNAAQAEGHRALRRLQAVETLRPGHCDRHRRLPAPHRQRQARLLRRSLWRHGRTRRACAAPRETPHGPPMALIQPRRPP